MSSNHSASSSSSSLGSLFTERPDSSSTIASSDTPPIEGLYIFKDAIPADLAQRVINGISQDGFFNTSRDQVMFFTRSSSDGSTLGSSSEGLPAYLLDLLDHLKPALRSNLPEHSWRAAFDQRLARQIIINLYPPGEGISPHVDLVHRYGDGVVGVSLFGSTTMIFRRVPPYADGATTTMEEEAKKAELEPHSVHLPPRSVYILTGAARYDYTHGIDGREVDLVRRENGRVESIIRGSRMSVTFRWMKGGGDILC